MKIDIIFNKDGWRLTSSFNKDAWRLTLALISCLKQLNCLLIEIIEILIKNTPNYSFGINIFFYGWMFNFRKIIIIIILIILTLINVMLKLYKFNDCSSALKFNKFGCEKLNKFTKKAIKQLIKLNWKLLLKNCKHFRNNNE